VARLEKMGPHAERGAQQIGTSKTKPKAKWRKQQDDEFELIGRRKRTKVENGKKHTRIGAPMAAPSSPYA
jgi:hypothetical protein